MVAERLTALREVQAREPAAPAAATVGGSAAAGGRPAGMVRWLAAAPVCELGQTLQTPAAACSPNWPGMHAWPASQADRFLPATQGEDWISELVERVWPYAKAAIEQMAWEQLPGGWDARSPANASAALSPAWPLLTACRRRIIAVEPSACLPPCCPACPCSHPGGERAVLDPRHQPAKVPAGGQGAIALASCASLHRACVEPALSDAPASGTARARSPPSHSSQRCPPRPQPPDVRPSLSLQEPDLSNIRVWTDASSLMDDAFVEVDFEWRSKQASWRGEAGRQGGEGFSCCGCM